MIKENSGKIFKFNLDFGKGFAYAQMYDLTDISDFNGILLQVFNLIESDPNTLPEIQKVIDSGIMLGPISVNRFPNTKGENSWALIGSVGVSNFVSPIFKDYKGILLKKDWTEYKPWYKENIFEQDGIDTKFEYEEVRHLETKILNHIEMVRIKATMMKIISDNDNVNSYYDLSQVGFRNIYLQVVNTYYSHEKAVKLLEIIK